MTHFGIICPGVPGHLNPMMALAQELQQRGHRLTLINVLDAEASAQAAGIEFRAIAPDEFPLGKTQKLQEIDGELSGLDAFKFTVTTFTELVDIRLRNTPAVIREANIIARFTNSCQLHPATGTAQTCKSFYYSCRLKLSVGIPECRSTDGSNSHWR